MANKSICSVAGCCNTVHSKKYCGKHYRRFLKNGDPLVTKIGHGADCSDPECDRPAIARGLCSKHYARLSRHGSTASRSSPHKFLCEVVIQYDDPDCLIWPFSRSKDGYASMVHRSSPRSACAVICELVYGPKPAHDIHAAHSCGNGHLGCVNPLHLRWATPAENVSDKRKHGTHLEGESVPLSKLKEADIPKIRELCKSTSLAKVGAMYGVTAQTIFSVKAGKTWTHIP